MVTLREVTRKISTLALLAPSNFLPWAPQAPKSAGPRKRGSPLVRLYRRGVPMGQFPGIWRRDEGVQEGKAVDSDELGSRPTQPLAGNLGQISQGTRHASEAILALLDQSIC